LDAAARVWSAFGDDSLSAGRLDMAEWALCEALRLARIHRLNATASILSGLAKLKSRQGDERSAEALFAGALAAPPNMTPRQAIYSNRGQSRLQFGNLRGALADFREARRIADQMRADIVPADQDRIKLESGLSMVLQGLVDAGNRLARQTGDRAVLEETFDAAEQDRLWSLRALVPSPNDWRSRLPDRYWEALAEFQSLERTAVEQRTPEIEKNIAGLQVELQQIEANAAGTDSTNSVPALHPESPLAHVRRILDDDTVLLSFHVSKTSSWVWAVDRSGVDVYPVRLSGRAAPQVTEFSKAIKEGRPAAPLGREIYSDLFGAVAERYLRHRRWLLELDGPLYELPFAALTAGGSDTAPTYLIERAALQSIPSALLLEPGAIPGDGGFLGVGDPVYNTADSRYRGSRGSSDLTLPRLPNTAAELDACARAWSSQDSRLLTGTEARSNTLQAALKTNPAIIHFATHVVTAPGEFRSGMIALSLDPAGEMGLLGPEEIVARPVAASLVVMDGCHSAQGESLPSAGLMGLTRAWIGAGAKAVMATQWDVPDDAAESLMTEFYRALRSDPKHRAAVALRQAQVSGLRKDPKSSGSWAGYFLLSKAL
jgi:CHAT domain-containing protein